MTKSTTIVFAVIALLILGVIIFLTYPKSTVAPADSAATTTGQAAVPATPGKAAGGTTKVLPTGTTGSAPNIGLSKVLLKDATSVSLYSGVDPAGRAVYKAVPDVDVATFKALTELTAIEHPSEKKGSVVTTLGVGSVAYYKDKNRVYVLSVFETSATTQTSIQVAQDAEVSSFAPLANSWYAKDKTHIFRLEAPTSDAHAPGTYAWAPYDLKAIANVDVASFTLVSNAAVNYDAHDKSHSYRKGIEVGVYPAN